MKKLFEVHWSKTTDPYKLNLDNEFDPIGDNHVFNLEYKKFDFKGGEPHIQITSPVEYVGALFITQRYNKIGDLFDIILANDAARRMGFKDIHLVLPYFPAARQDRVCNEGEPLTIKVFTDMINGCEFASVTILCPHSEVTPALINNVNVLDEFKYVEKCILKFCEIPYFRDVNIVCPDAGAGKRVGKIVQHLSSWCPERTFHLIRCEKIRDVKDGSLKEFFVQADDLGGYPTLIVDDIVAMGGTFVGLGEKLKEKNCGKLALFTTHADCHEGLDKMTHFFDAVFTTNSKKNWNKYQWLNDKLICFDIVL